MVIKFRSAPLFQALKRFKVFFIESFFSRVEEIVDSNEALRRSRRGPYVFIWKHLSAVS